MLTLTTSVLIFLLLISCYYALILVFKDENTTAGLCWSGAVVALFGLLPTIPALPLISDLQAVQQPLALISAGISVLLLSLGLAFQAQPQKG